MAKARAIDRVARVHATITEIDASAWDALLAVQAAPSPFMRHAYLSALEQSQSAVPTSGWTPRFFTLWQGRELMAACPLYIKDHSYGEYVFDWAWANAYQEHGLHYYPKGLVAVPFTPVPGTRVPAGPLWSRPWSPGARNSACRPCTCSLGPMKTSPPAPKQA